MPLRPVDDGVALERVRRRAVCRVGGLLAGGWLAGCAGGDAADGTVVEMVDERAFRPADLTVPVGGSVVWVNRGSLAHTVTAYADRIPPGAAYFASGGFDSERAARDAFPPYGGLDAGVSYRHTFRTPGTFEYFCIAHESEGMTGTVTVRE